MKHSNKTGSVSSAMTRAEALDVLAQCRLIRMSVDALEERAKKALARPRLEVIDGKANKIRKGS